jgi:hypothetical protein
MDYGKVLSRAWEITWRWKVLWILGFLAALGRGGSAGNPSYTTDSSDWGYTYYGPRIPPEIISLLIGIACVALIILIALWVVSVIARGGLIAGVQQVEEEGSTTFRRAWRAGASRFWTLVGIGILAAIPFIILLVGGMIVLVLMFVGSGFALDSSTAGGVTGLVISIICGGVFCCGTIILGIILGQIRIYAERAAILESLGWIEAFKRGWEVLKENLGPTLVFWLIFLAIGLIFGMLVIGGLAVVLAPFIAIVVNMDPGPWLVVPICFGGLLGTLVFALIGSIVETFGSATWTLAYRELTGLAAAPAAALEAEPTAE